MSLKNFLTYIKNYMRFDPIPHKYYNNQNELYVSVTQLIEHYKQEFEEEYWSYYTAYRKVLGYDKDTFKEYVKAKGIRYGTNKSIDNIFYLANQDGISKELLKQAKQAVKDEWKDTNKQATDKGSNFHNRKETSDDYQKVFTEKVFTARTVNEDLWNLDRPDYFNSLEDGWYREIKLVNHNHKLAGTIDELFIETIDGIRYVDINDWKGLALDTPIATKEGWKLMEDITTSDEIFDGNGKLTKVKNVSEIHYNPCYKITFDTGDTLIADHEHRWVISYMEKRKLVEKEVTTLDILNNLSRIRLKIKCTSIELPEVQLPIDPYVLGVWLADGNSHNGSITNLNVNIWTEIQNRGYKIGNNLSINNDRAEARTVFGLFSGLNSLNLIKNKHIPDIYFRSSYNQRLDLLRGFMDGDGFFHRKRKRCVMNTTKKWQAEAISELIASLGGKPSTFFYKGKGFGKVDIPMYDVCFTLKQNPFLSRNNDYPEIVKEVNFTRSEYRNIRCIEKIETVPTKCLEVESETHCYLAGKSLIKTHNTNKEIKFSNKFQNMKVPVAHLQDTNFNHYTLQISTYALMLELMGFKPRHLQLTHIQYIGEVEYEIPLPLKYLKQDVQNILNDYADKRIFFE